MFSLNMEAVPSYGEEKRNTCSFSVTNFDANLINNVLVKHIFQIYKGLNFLKLT